MHSVLLFALAGTSLCSTVAAVVLWLRRPAGGRLQKAADARKIVLVPVARQLAEQLTEWSKPVQIRLEPNQTSIWELSAKELA